MISVVDDFLSKEEFWDLQYYCDSNLFQIVSFPGKSFSALATPQHMYDKLKIEGHEIILTFIRSAYKGFDEDIRIHADNIIDGHKTSMASVLYINNEYGVTPNGTAFWSHMTYGKDLPVNCTEEEFNDVILKDSNDRSKWVFNDYISSRPNRLLTYDANYFHSKFPAEITEGIRKVLVTFYKKI